MKFGFPRAMRAFNRYIGILATNIYGRIMRQLSEKKAHLWKACTLSLVNKMREFLQNFGMLLRQGCWL